jgi:D-alanyl-D-alanine carboxypeptidase/D-alanyl-D-alanine-endopeptidase (penicillin-binding protein 4)
MKKSLYFLLFLLLPAISAAQTRTGTKQEERPWPQEVEARIGTLLDDPLLETSQLGLMVWDLTADSAIWCHNERQLLRPASTMKLLTAVTALDFLGVDYRLSTRLYYKGTVRDSVFYGSVYCRGGMDPMIDQSDIYAFADALRGMGVKSIKGSIVADKTMKDSLLWGEGWCWDDKNPPLLPLSVGRDDSFMSRFMGQLNDCGIWLDSIGLHEGPVPADALLICVRQHSLDDVLLKMMKESDNFYAECVLYQIAAADGRRYARAAQALSTERQLINRIGLRATDYRLADGCGLSLYNYLSAELLTRLLRYAWRMPQIREHLLPVLPVAATDGTLKDRMRKTAAAQNVQAKTGTLTGISSLAGYCTAANGHQLCFAIINQGVMSWRTARAFQDKICDALCK